MTSRHPIDPYFVEFYDHHFSSYRLDNTSFLVEQKPNEVLPFSIIPSFVAMWMLMNEQTIKRVIIKTSNMFSERGHHAPKLRQECIIDLNDNNLAISVVNENVFLYTAVIDLNTILTGEIEDVTGIMKSCEYINQELRRIWKSDLNKLYKYFINFKEGFCIGTYSEKIFIEKELGRLLMSSIELDEDFFSMDNNNNNNDNNCHSTSYMSFSNIGHNKNAIKFQNTEYTQNILLSGCLSISKPLRGHIIVGNSCVCMLDGQSNFDNIECNYSGVKTKSFGRHISISYTLNFFSVVYPKEYWNVFIAPHFHQLDIIESNPERLGDFQEYLSEWWGILPTVTINEEVHTIIDLVRSLIVNKVCLFGLDWILL